MNQKKTISMTIAARKKTTYQGTTREGMIKVAIRQEGEEGNGPETMTTTMMAATAKVMVVIRSRSRSRHHHHARPEGSVLFHQKFSFK